MKQPRRPAEPFASQGGVLVLGHRGWSGRYPENTLLAFSQALELGVDGLELDVQRTADGVLVVSHDPTVNRVTDGRGRIRRMRWSAVQRLDAGYRWSPDGGKTHPFRGQGLRMPAVEEVFARFPNVWLNLDIKEHTPEAARQLARLAQEYRVESQLCVGSFDPATLGVFADACPTVVTIASRRASARLALASRLPLKAPQIARALVVQVPPRYLGLTIVNRSFIATAHDAELAVHAWTVNEEAEMRELIACGVDGIITDYPERLIDLLNGNAPRMSDSQP